MKETFEFLKKEFGIDMFNDFILHGDTNYYFYQDLNAKDNIMETEFISISGEFPFNVLPKSESVKKPVLSFKYLLQFLNLKCEKIEYMGLNRFFEECQQNINNVLIDCESKFILPLFDGAKKNTFFEVKIVYLPNKKIVLGSFKDNTDEEIKDEALYVTSYKDTLTGLFNRNTCMFHLESINPLDNIHFLMIDLNHFKLVNDLLGHNTGDNVLHQFGDNLMKIISPKIMFYRLAGDEFICQAKDINRDQAIKLAKTINDCARAITLPNMELTASVGIVKYEPGMDVYKILRYVDYAMYEAKHNKRLCYAYPGISKLKKIESKKALK